MKRNLLIAISLLCAFMAQAADLSEDFSSLAKGKYGAGGEQVLTLPTGEWNTLKMELKESSGVRQFTFSNGKSSYLITPAVDDPGKIAVDWGSGGNNKLTISYSVNEGAWQLLAEISSGGSGVKSYSAKTALDGLANVRFRFVGSSSNTYISKVTIKSVNTQPELDDPTYITEGAWIPTKAFPTAAKEFYIAPDGNDNTGDGTIEKPWFNLQKAINAATPGTHIICRGGTYLQKVQGDGKFTVRIKNSGSADAPIVIRCYDGEQPVFDFKNGLTAERVGERGLTITGDYWWLFGLHITHAADNGIKLEGSHNRIERCEFSYNLDTGLQLVDSRRQSLYLWGLFAGSFQQTVAILYGLIIVGYQLGRGTIGQTNIRWNNLVFVRRIIHIFPQIIEHLNLRVCLRQSSRELTRHLHTLCGIDIQVGHGIATLELLKSPFGAA